MKRDLIKQMRNEWAENVWMVLELLIVLIIVWIVCWLLVRTYRTHSQPKGFDACDVYVLKIKSVDKSSSEYIDFGDDETAGMRTGEDLLILLDRFRNNHKVEAAALSYNGLPYQYSFIGNHIVPLNGDSVYPLVNIRKVSPDMARVLRYESLDGKTPAQLEKLLKKGETLLATNSWYKDWRNPDDLKNIPFIIAGDSVPQYRTTSLIRKVVRNEFETFDPGTLIIPLSDAVILAGHDLWELAVRLKPGTAAEFMQEFANSPQLRRHRNTYLLEPQSLLRLRDRVQRTDMIQIRMVIGASVCLLLIVLLGVIGTFRYRVSRREGEIAIRKVNGATSADIFRRLISEGVILLSAAAVIAVIVGVIYVYFGHPEEDDKYYLKSMIPGLCIAYGLLLSVVCGGIAIPASKAVKVKPAIALKDE